jgi:two-component system chemotaxis response regulator CheB
MDMNEPKFIVVVGASAGGMNAAVFIVMHLSKTSISDFLMIRLKPLTALPCEIATEGALIQKGHIYFASPNLHLLVKKGSISLGRGPEENRWRPSIDVLFRSAAAAYSTRTIGVVLTGLLNDGTTGMLAIQRSGGISIVQDPNEAEFPDMPLSVLNTMEVDHCISLGEMGEVISGITRTTREEKPAPEDVIIESQIAERIVVDYDHVRQLGEKSIYACPDCGGGLWEINKGGPGQGKVDRYRCHIGHSYSERDLVIKQGETFEATLWTALRMMEERRNLLKKLEGDHAKKGLSTMAKNYKEKADEIQTHVDKLKEVLFASQKLL